MKKHEVYAIDARMIESSGIGTYIRMVMRSGIYKVALGDGETIHKYFPDITVIPFGYKIYSIGEQLHFPVRKLKKAGVTVFHSPHYNAPVFWNGKLMVTIHDLIHLKFPEYLPNKLAYIYARAMLQFDCLRAYRIYTVSEYSKRDIVKSLNVKERKIVVTYSTIEDIFDKEDKTETLYLYEKYGIPKEARIILYVGNIKPHKNVKMIIESFKKLGDVSARLVLVGRAFDDGVKTKLGIDNNLSGNIILTGEVGQQEVVDWYNLADVFVFPSLYEGFGIPPLEAMACGTPVICSDAASLPEVVGDAAIIVKPDSADGLAAAMKSVLDMDGVEKREMVVKGCKRVGYFRHMEAGIKSALLI